MGSKVARVIGYILCGIMFVLCGLLVFASIAFTAEETVNIFGVNIYVVEDEGIATVQQGSAVIVNPCAPYEVKAGKLVLYKNNEKLSLGYGKSFSVQDGIYQITVLENDKEYVISESNFIGKADYSSAALGKIITFIKSPFGVFCLAIVPCILLVIYDIIRAAAGRRPLPEVVPQVKNRNTEQVQQTRGISVASDGKGTYSRSALNKSSSQADEVLFTYTAKQKRVEKKETHIIPLSEKSAKEPPVKAKNAGALRPETPSDSTARFTKVSSQSSSKVSEASEKFSKNSEFGDAFFSQSAVPQIQKSVYSRSMRNSSGEAEKSEDIEEMPRPQKTSSKRSTQIIANKNVDDLMKDDEDVRDKSRYNDADEIISGFNKRV